MLLTNVFSNCRLIMAVITVIVLDPSLCAGDGVSDVETAYSLFNERGYYKSSSFTTDGQEVINNFNGNLVYTKTLDFLPTTASGVQQLLQICYNGSVSHVLSTGPTVVVGCTKQISVSIPEWIISLNGYALQTFNFENDFISVETPTFNDPDSTSAHADVALLINGYHTCNGSTGNPVRYTVLMGDGSLKTLQNYNTSDFFYTMNEADRTKASRNSSSPYTVTVYNDDGTRVEFKQVRPSWRTNNVQGTATAEVLLPTKFMDRFNNVVPVEYYYKLSDSSLIQGRPILKRVGNYWFDWGEGFLDSAGGSGWTNELKIYSYQGPDSHDSLLYTISVGDLEAGTTVVETIGDRNRGLVTQIRDRLDRTEQFSYARYKRLGTNIIPFSQLCADHPIAPNFYIEPFRLFCRINQAGGYTRYKYVDDDNVNVCSWTWWPETLTYSVGEGQAAVSEVDFDWQDDCLEDELPLHPCHRSDGFLDYGRDPFFVNMVIGKVRYVCNNGILGNKDEISYDSLVFSWVDPNNNDDSTYTSEDDTLQTKWIIDSTWAGVGDEWPIKINVFTFGTYKEPWGTALIRDRGYATKMLSSTTCEYTGYSPAKDTTNKTINYWRLGTLSGRLLLDSTDTYQDGQMRRTRFEYAHVSTDDPLCPGGDTLVNIIRRAETNAFDIRTTTYYSDDYLEPDPFYSNTLIDSQIVEAPLKYGSRDILSKTYREFYVESDTLGYVGQVRSEATVELLKPGLIVDTLVSQFEYFKNVGDSIPAGALKKSIDPMGYVTEYFYHDTGPDSTVRIIDTLEVRDTADDTLTFKDSIYIECEGEIDYNLTFFECSADYTVASVHGTGWYIMVRGWDGIEDSSGTVHVGPDEWVYVYACLGGDDPGYVSARAVIHDCSLEELICPVKYYKSCTDGSVDTALEAFGNRGPFWYKQQSYLEDDTITTYQLVDSLGLPRKYVSANGFLSELTWDEIRRMKAVTLPYSFSPTGGYEYTIRNFYHDGLDIFNSYIELDQFTARGSGLADRRATYIFDGFWRNRQTDLWYAGMGYHFTLNKHDCLDRVVRSRDQEGYWTSTAFDALHRTKTITYPDPSSSEVNQSYDTSSFAGALADYPFEVPSGNSYLWVTKTINENGDSIKSYADALGQQRAVKQFVGDSVHTTYFDYNELGKLLTIQKPEGDSVGYVYDLLGRMRKQWSADSDTAEFVYNKNGNVVLRKDGSLTAGDTCGDTVILQEVTLGSGACGYINVDTIIVDKEGFISWRLGFIGDASESGTYAKIYRGDPGSEEIIDIVKRSSDTCCSEGIGYFYQGDTIMLDERRMCGETCDSVYAEATYYVAEESESWIYSHHDALNRLTESGLVRLKDSCNADSCWISDTLAHFPINLLYYDQSQSVNSRGKLSVAYTNDSGYQYAERYHYDARGRVSEKLNIFDVYQDTMLMSDFTTQFPGDTFTVSYEYDQSDKVTKIRYPNDTVITFHYDMRGRLASIGDSLDADKYATISYTARDEIEQMILGDGLQLMDYEYNERGWLTSINDGITADTSSDMFGEILEYYGTERDTAWPAYYNGNIAAQKLAFSRSDTIVHLYEYDQTDRLVDAHMGTASDTAIEPYREYTYDKNGNRLSLNIDGGPNEWTYVYKANSNQLASRGYLGSLHTAYTYDASGNVDSSDFLYTYDLYNQLSRADTSGGSAYLKFGYNVAGERIWKEYHWAYLDSTGGDDSIPIFPLMMMMMGGGGGGVPPQIVHDSSITWYIRGADGKVLAEYDPLNEEYIHTFIYAGDQRIAMFDKLGALHFYLNDHLGSARRVIAANGTPKDKYVYHPFGGESSFTVNTLQTRRYTGKPLDEEMGLDLYYYGARYYDPELGRFTQIDPLADKYPGWGPYVYALNNPIRFIDPDGEVVGLLGLLAMAAYIVLTTPDMANAPTEPGDVQQYSTGEKVVQWAEAIGGAAGIQSANRGFGRIGQSSTEPSVTSTTIKVADEAAGAPRGTRNPNVNKAIKEGIQAHRELAGKVKAKKGWQSQPRLTDPKTGRPVVPDAVTPSGHPVELKPNTPSGRARGAQQMKKYERATGRTGRVIYY